MIRIATLTAALALFIAPASAAQTCTGGTVLGGNCIRWQIDVDPATGLPLGTAASPMYTTPAPGGGSQHVTVDNPSNGGGASAAAPAALWWTEISAQSVPASGLAGASRSSGASAGQAGSYAYFIAEASSTQAGTLTITNETTPALSVSYPLSASAITSGTGLVTGKVPAFGAAFHASFTPAAAATVSLSDGYTAN